MTKRVALVCMLCFLLFSAMIAVFVARSFGDGPGYGVNLLVNPGFEDESPLHGWTTSSGTATYSADYSAYLSEAPSCRGVENTTGSLGRLYQNVTGVTSSGNQYQISGWIMTSGVTGSVVIALDYVGAGGSTPADGYVMEIGYVTGTTEDWEFFQSDVFTLPSKPSDAQALWFLFDFNSGAGTAWWDDVSLILVASPTPVTVPTGTNVAVELNANVGLVFDKVAVAGSATALTTMSYPPPPSGTTFIEPVWDIKTTAKFSGNVTIGIAYPDPDADPGTPTQMLRTEIVAGDVNLDGVVNAKDLLLILKAVGTRPGSRLWNPNCDLNHDNRINALDLLIALKNYGKTSQWTDITWYVDTVNHIIYGRTTHFSIIGIH
jgi:hypothetical protein